MGEHDEQGAMGLMLGLLCSGVMHVLYMNTCDCTPPIRVRVLLRLRPEHGLPLSL